MTNPSVKHTTLNGTPTQPKIWRRRQILSLANFAFLAPKVWRRRQIFGWGGGGGDVKGCIVVCLTQGLVTLPTLVINSW